MKVEKFLEFVQDDFEAVESFHIKDKLNEKVWEDNKNMKEDVKEKLLTISQDFYNTTSLNAEIKDQMAHISVKDNGVGINEENQKKIFLKNRLSIRNKGVLLF